MFSDSIDVKMFTILKPNISAFLFAKEARIALVSNVYDAWICLFCKVPPAKVEICKCTTQIANYSVCRP